MKEQIDLEAIKKELYNQIKARKANCFHSMDPRFIDYIPGKSLTIGFPVKETYLNPARGMQGGLITAAFDNVFGALCHFESKEEAIATIDISTTYQRPITMGDELIVNVGIKSMGKTIVHMCGEAYNKEGKLVATSTTNFILLKNKNK
ncbi:thioesterase superfamily protein [Clostridium homopropionicum DSM 5847]|uniref:Thioesterase superfamily protein n=1 Tax=Clostridium homopropionicum DSM 5847 TaxID=1121318 RepID=A0A0L6Z7S1_9CLOT|nr:PaaI family thioesterase [Clostridium homopropionicum]KOA19017.1 thioesterase superfamily protein [Clostridium homopropionicum DSM 5847]SFH00801.1 uncharacterized domain 1-containing protein [Clostridium homopropionicum]